MFGRLIESTLGVKHFLIYDLICGIGAGFCQEIFQYGEYCVEGLANFERVRTPDGIYPMGEFLNYWRTVGASGAVYGILLAGTVLLLLNLIWKVRLMKAEKRLIEAGKEAAA